MLGIFVFVYPPISQAVVTQKPSGHPSHWLDCSHVIQAPLDTRTPASELIAQGFMASRCYDYDLLLVQSNAIGIKAYQVEHWVSAQGERSSVRALDSKVQDADARRPLPSLIRLLGASSPIEELMKRYSFATLGQYYIGGREAIEIAANPRDDHRYGQRFWLDRRSGLIVKREIRDADGQPLESTEVVRLAGLSAYQGSIAISEAPVNRQRQSGQLVKWLPHGFESLRNTDVVILGQKMITRLYGDGLSSLSVFVGPWVTQASLPVGLNRIGAEKAMVLHQGQVGSGCQIVVIGEVPEEVLFKVARNVNTASVELQ